MKTQDTYRQLGREYLRGGKRGVLLAFADFAAVLVESTASVADIERLRQRVGADLWLKKSLVEQRLAALRDSTQAALRLGRHAEAEATARLILTELSGENKNLHPPAEEAAAHALLALAVARQSRGAEALTVVDPALRIYRDLRAKDADGVDFRQDFAFALYVQAMARADDADGRAQRRAALDEAATLLDGLSDEAKQLHD
ncbi:MAG: hypothetical protein EXS37_15305 [Opitutus sp.]|nr:hypothetical protein [Opitutus sp.]